MTGDAAAKGYKALVKISAKVRNGTEVAPIAVRDLLRMFGAKYRGVRTNQLIRQALFENGIHTEADLNAQGLDDFIEFRAGWKIDETERLFHDNYRELHEGSVLTEIEAAMLNKLYLERVYDSLMGWIDRNPGVSESEIRARAASLNELEFDDLEREDGAEIITFPEAPSRTSVPPIDNVGTHVASNTSISEADSRVLRSYYEQRRKMIG